MKRVVANARMLSCLMALASVLACGGKVIFEDGAGGESSTSGSLSVSTQISSTAAFFASSSATSSSSNGCQEAHHEGGAMCSADGTCFGVPVSISCVVVPEKQDCICTAGDLTINATCDGSRPDPCSLESGCCSGFFFPKP